MYAGGPWNQSAFSRGGEGGTPIHETNSVRSTWFQDGKIDFSCYIDPMLRRIRAAAN